MSDKYLSRGQNTGMQIFGGLWLCVVPHTTVDVSASTSDVVIGL
jgi:hypothetical protein